MAGKQATKAHVGTQSRREDSESIFVTDMKIHRGNTSCGRDNFIKIKKKKIFMSHLTQNFKLDWKIYKIYKVGIFSCYHFQVKGRPKALPKNMGESPKFLLDSKYYSNF